MLHYIVTALFSLAAAENVLMGLKHMPSSPSFPSPNRQDIKYKGVNNISVLYVFLSRIHVARNAIDDSIELYIMY